VNNNDAVFQFSPARRKFIMATLLLSTVLASLDTSVVPLSAANMIDLLKASSGTVVWVTLGYLIAASGPMLLTAKLAARFGQARLFQLGTAVYALAMIACTWAPDLNTLIFFRLVQGVGLAIFLPTTFAIASMISNTEGRPKALGLLQSANALGLVLGPIFAGFLLDSYDWRAVFGARIPLGIFAIALSLVAFGADPLKVPQAAKQKIDYVGAMLLTISLFGLLFGFTRLPVEDNHLDWFMWLIFAGGAAVMYLFIYQQGKSQQPLMDFSLLDITRFRKAAVGFSMLFASFPVYLFTLPIVLVNGLEIRSYTVGIIMASVAVCTMFTSPLAGRYAEKIGPEKLCTIGASMNIFGYILLMLMTPESSVYYLLLPMCFLGVGAGLYFTPNNYILMSSPPPEKMATVSGLIGTFRQVGYAVGFAIAASLFTVMQDIFEANWAYAGLRFISNDSAVYIADLFHNGGQWSPEVLIYILRLTAIVSIALMIPCLLNSLPSTEMNGKKQLATLVLSLIAAVGFSAAYGSLSTDVSIDTSSVEQLEEQQSFEMLAFGMSERQPRAIVESVVINAADDIDGSALFNQQCSVCHGANANGVANLGVSLVANNFLDKQDTSSFAEFLKQGRMPNAPDSVSGRMMPPFAALQSAEAGAIYKYLKTLNK
jgi:EmrB/QacA subfamily drug resistance transporter